MKKIVKEWKEFLTESSISRTYEHILNHDTAFITAFRDNTKDRTKCMPDHSNTMEKYERKMQLKSVLLNKGYGVTDVDGTYVEDFGTDAAKEVKEDRRPVPLVGSSLRHEVTMRSDRELHDKVRESKRSIQIIFAKRARAVLLQGFQLTTHRLRPLMSDLR